MKNELLNTLKLPDYATLLALVLSWFAVVLLLKSLFFASLGVAVFALMADMMDGFLARKYGGSSFGKYIDSFLDVILYLLYPSLFLFILGLSNIISAIVLAIFITAGVLRLARFTAQGFEEDKGQRYYRGMPVFWNLLWLYIIALLFRRGLSHWLIVDIAVIVISWLMVSTIRVPKPGSYLFLIPLLLITGVVSIVIEFIKL